MPAAPAHKDGVTGSKVIQRAVVARRALELSQ